MSLLIYRILEQKLDYKYTINEIIDSLKEMRIGVLNESLFQLEFFYDDIYKELNEIFNVGIFRKYVSNVQLNKLFR